MPAPKAAAGSFSATYEESRERFLQAADSAGYRTLRFRVPHEDCADLFLDFALLRRDPRKVLIHLAGVHGIEGYAGAAVQSALLANAPAENGPSLLFVHGLNPYGMKFYRRANGYNVDLNRNYRKGPARPNPDYALFADFLHPPAATAFRREKLRGLFRALRLGFGRAAQAIAGGQVSHPRGLFYMGDRIQREIHQLQEMLRNHCGEAEEVLVLDFHTGLGRYRQEQLFVDRDLDAGADAFVETTFGRAAERPAVSYATQGRLSDAIRDALPNARLRYVLQEMGARSPLRTLEALRHENFEWQSRPGGSARPAAIVDLMMDAFYPPENAWRTSIVAAGVGRWRQAERALAETLCPLDSLEQR